MSRIRVRIKGGHKAKVNIKNAQPVQVKTDTTYLYDPTIIDKEVQQAKDWAIKTDGLVEEEGVGIDYSAKAYAIGGTGTTTNNAKYYAEQAGISETNASNSATSASGSASSASSSASLAKDWATKTDGTVDGVDYSAKYYAQQITPIATDITTVAGIASDVTTVSNNSTNITTVAGNTTNINKVASDINRVNLVADDIDSVHTVAVDISTVIDVANNKTNIDAVAGNATNINAVAGNETNINAVAGNATNINAVNANKTNIDTVAGISSDVTAVASNESNINAVADNETNINAVNANKTNIDAVAGNETNINAVVNNESNINAVADNESNINAVNANKTNIDAVAGNATNINAVANNSTNINAVAGNATNINAVASDTTNIDAVAGDLTNINAVANDLTNIDNASTYANNANIWAEGTDIQVADLGGEKSSKGWAARAKELVDSIGSVLHYKGSVATRADLPTTGQVLGDMYNITSDGSNVVWGGSDWDEISGIVDLSAYRKASDQDTIDAGKVPTSRTVNGKALSSNISLTASDVGALPDSTTIGNATLTIQKNGTTIDTFTANATSDKTVNVTVPTDTNDLSNGAGFITNSALSNYVTLNTLQTLSSGKKIFANDAVMAGNQTALLATISNSNTTTSDNAWVGRYICGAKNLTFLMGTYRTMAGIGAHSWTNAQTGSGAGWADFYLNPDGGQTVYIGGYNWTKDSGWFKVKNSGSNSGGLIQVNKGTITSPSWKDVAYKGENLSDFNNNSGFITLSSVGTGTLTIQKNGTAVDTFNANATSDKTINITVPTNNNELTNGAGYQTAGDVASAISVETTNRENADIGLQQQIDAITASSDVKDIVGTYAQLQAYDTSTLGNNDIIKVLQDETHDNETTYYRWSTTTETFTLIGEEGPYYTKSEADSAFVPQTRTINNKALSSNITLTASDVGALPDSTVIPTVNNATLTIQKNGTSVATFTANSSTNATANITVPTKTSDLTNDDGFITGITSSDVTTALGYTPYNSSNPSGYQENVIETVKVNGTALTPSSKAVDITVPTNNNQLTNGAGYITSSALTGYATETWVGQQGFLTSTALNGYATESWVGQQGYITGITSSDVTTALGYTPYNSSNPDGYITGITSAMVTTALGYTPYDASNPNGYTSNTGTVTSVNNVSPTNGNVTLSIPSDTSDLTNGAGFITSSALSGYQTTSNLVTSVSSASTDSQYPSAKLFYDTCGDIETLINAL